MAAGMRYRKLFLPGNRSSFLGRFQPARTKLSPAPPRWRESRQGRGPLYLLPFWRKNRVKEWILVHTRTHTYTQRHRQTRESGLHDGVDKRLFRAGVWAETTWRKWRKILINNQHMVPAITCLYKTYQQLKIHPATLRTLEPSLTKKN